MTWVDSDSKSHVKHDNMYLMVDIFHI